MGYLFIVLASLLTYAFYSPKIVVATQLEATVTKESLAQAKVIFEQKCSTIATETISSTIENVSSFMRVDEHESGRTFVGGIQMDHGPFGGESNTHPHYMFFRLGLDFVEYELPSTEREKVKKRFGRFDLHSRKSEAIDTMKSLYGVRFKTIASAEEEAIGIRGRQIDVFEISSGIVLATRKEFFGRHPDFSRAAATGVCPPLQPGQATPTSFLSRVINPISYGCWHKTEQYSGNPTKQEERIARIRECESEYQRSKSHTSGIPPQELPK